MRKFKCWLKTGHTKKVIFNNVDNGVNLQLVCATCGKKFEEAFVSSKRPKAFRDSVYHGLMNHDISVLTKTKFCLRSVCIRLHPRFWLFKIKQGIGKIIPLIAIRKLLELTGYWLMCYDERTTWSYHDPMQHIVMALTGVEPLDAVQLADLKEFEDEI